MSHAIELLQQAQVSGDQTLIKYAKTRITGSYLLKMREVIETNLLIGNIFRQQSIDPDQLKNRLDEAFKQLPEFYDSAVFESYQEALSILIDEWLKSKGEPGLQLISTETGRKLMNITEKDLYQPPDYIGEDGKVHKAKLRLHPGLESSMAMELYEARLNDQKLQYIAKQIAANPVAQLAYDHILNTSKILEAANRVLNKHNVKEGVINDPKEVIFEIGKEQLDGIFQSPNLGFHRANLFGIILAKKILNLGNITTFKFKSIQIRQTSKYRWFEVKIELPTES